ncbi:T9SS type A sorting domain-containing protein [Membranihabitans marinus]|uniref:T9SS type A sorting domain-containing protein n=1 Tax=Membranihabitans marinus TaxID=1227546 RepID=UPI001F2BC194|nr:T9SS type A sorting domain-containing protein [Membranihabitans marinus]
MQLFNENIGCIQQIKYVCHIVILLFTYPVIGQWSINQIDSTANIDFDQTLDGVCNDTFTGSGFAPAPSPGNLDSDAWKILGFTAGDLNFGETATENDFARGISEGGKTTGGIYAFIHSPNNHSFGFQPTGGDFTPGQIILRAINNTGMEVNGLNINYQIWTYNNENRSSHIKFSWSLDDVIYHDIPSLDYISPEAESDSAVWNMTYRQGDIDTILPSASSIYLRWTTNDEGGSGSRDELAIDEINLRMLSSGLPIYIQAFKAKWQDKAIKVVWQLLNIDELFAQYHLQHSNNGYQWEDIFVTEAMKDGSGLHDFTYYYSPKSSDEHFFRLKIHSVNSPTIYSRTENLKPESQSSKITIYPNPSDGHIKIDWGPFSQNTNIYLVSNLGQIVLRDIGYRDKTLDLSFLPSGIYFLVIEDRGELECKKIELVR